MERMKKKFKIASFSVIVAFVALMLVGISFLPLLNIQFEPSRSLPSLSVSYRWYNASARIIEQDVTSKLEGLFSTIKGVESVNSESSKGSGRINLVFKKNTDLDALRFEVATAIRQAYPKLPEGVSFPELSVSSSGTRVRSLLSYTLNGSASPYFIQKYAESYLVPQLSLVKGVNEVKVSGGTSYEWEIKFKSALLDELGMHVHDIQRAINNYFREEIIGQVDFINGKKEIKPITLKIRNKQMTQVKWESIEIKQVDGRIIRMGDVATIRYKERPPRYYYRINGLNTINIQVYPEPGVNTIGLAKAVRAKMDELKKGLDSGYSVLLAKDNTEYLTKELKKIGYRTLLSMLILLLFVLIISRQFRYLLLIVISLIANLILAFIFYYIFNVEIHLYSLAGMTVSFGIIIDNSIVMIDHLRYQKNRKVFIAILAATLTTIGSLCIIFFLDEKQRANLTDFAWVIMINLSVSMLIALFFIPALMDKIKLKTKSQKRWIKRKRRTLRWANGYERFIRFGRRWRWAWIVIFILGFGLPVHWLPDQIEKEGFWPELYNKTIGGNWYQQDAKPIVERALGGALRLFTEHVFESSFYSSPQRTMLRVHGTMPEGCTIQQLNDVVGKMENFISQFDEIELFETSIYSYKNAVIRISFKDEFENGSFPFFLKEQITSKATSLGNLDWGVYGVGKGFNNSLGTGYKNSQIILEGYNYEELYRYAMDLKRELLRNNRIDDVEIAGRSGWRVQTLYEYYLDFDKEKFALHEVGVQDFYSFLQNRVYRQWLKPVFINDELQPVTLVSDRYGKFNVWDLRNEPMQVGDKRLKLDHLGTISKEKTGNNIYKYDQNYRLVVAYDFIGPHALSKLVRKRHLKRLDGILPLGYKAREREYSWWNRDNKKQYFLLLLIVGIIYFICSILLESFKQPLAIIALIPISFIGVFLTFYFFDFNFDQGGFASFILLCGLVVNAGVYIINDYNQFKRKRVNSVDIRSYMKAFNHKVIPIFLTIISTVLGLIPFVWSGQHEVFWFAFAAGAMGGLLFSFIAVLIYLPLFIIKKEKRKLKGSKV
ncbi:efflux RND transporter permease subunit [Prolixibacteraceae bacterium JC049]|nr:efflux RND transporter permease subunit [Prolixibacteraceae bacterium JC049]